MARETQMLNQLLKLMLNQDICPEDMAMEVMVMVVMATAVDMEDMDMAVDIMVRERLKLNLVILEDMVGMVVGMDMAVMDMVDMAIMVNFLILFISYFHHLARRLKQNCNKLYQSK